MKRLLISTLLLGLAALQTWADGYLYHYFKGQMGGKVSVEMAFQQFEGEDAGIVAGYMLYPKAKNPAPILLVGHRTAENWYHLKEYQSDGTITGWLNFQIGDEDCADGPTILEGEWTNPRNNATFALTTLQSPYDMIRTQMYPPSWLDMPLEYEDPGNMGRKYSYQQWNQNRKAMTGGNVTLRAAGKDKVYFTVSNCPQNMAEGSSQPGRPAVIDGEGCAFTYDGVNECGYGFKATFFKRFAVLESTTAYETFGCFGMNATFDGVYIKVKQ